MLISETVIFSGCAVTNMLQWVLLSWNRNHNLTYQAIKFGSTVYGVYPWHNHYHFWAWRNVTTL